VFEATPTPALMAFNFDWAYKQSQVGAAVDCWRPLGCVQKAAPHSAEWGPRHHAAAQHRPTASCA